MHGGAWKDLGPSTRWAGPEASVSEGLLFPFPVHAVGLAASGGAGHQTGRLNSARVCGTHR